MQNFRIKLSLFLNYFVFAILLNSVGTVILQVQRNYNITESAASVLEAFKDLSIAAASFLIASYVVRIGYKKTMLIALGLVTVACLVMPSLNSFLMTKVLFATVGVGFALIKVTVFATIGLITKDSKEHASFMSFIESFFMVGILTGYFIFSAFVDDVHPESTAWFKVYYILAALSFLAFLLLLTSPLDESSVHSEKSTSLTDDFGGMLKLIIIPIVLVFIFSAFFYVLIEQSIMSWLPTFNNKVLKLPTALSIQMASILAASTAIGRFLSGLLLRKVNWYALLTVCLLLAAGLVLLTVPLASKAGDHVITGWGNAPLVAFMFPIIGLLLAPVYPAINSVILSTLPKNMHGPMSGLIVIFSALGGTSGSIITGNIFHAYGGQTAFYFSLLPIAILVVILFFYYRLQKKHTANVEFNSTASH